MQKMRKVLALMLCFVMCASLFVPISFADGFSDVGADSKYYEAINYLASMGIINGFEDGIFKPEESVTRAQFAKIMAYSLGNSDVVASNQIFTDVPVDHWAAGNIEAMVARGIINGMGDGTFAPESPVLYEQAVKMAVCALGYDAVAQNNGGYPDGYLKVATNRGFIKNISDGVMGQAANRGLIAQLIDNMLGIDQLDPVTGEVTKNSSVKKDSGSESAKGQVVAAYRIGLTTDWSDDCKKSEIILLEGNDEVTYSIDGLSDSAQANIANYIGKLVTVNYTEESDGYSITSISEQKNKNDELTLESKDLYDYEDNTVEYYDEESGDFEEVSLASEHYILYNGKASDKNMETVVNELMTGDGEITFLASNGGNTYDVVFVKSYKTFIAGGSPTTVTTDDDYVMVYNKDNTTEKYTLPKESSSRVSVSYKLNGNSASYSSITAKSIVSIAISEDNTVFDVLISTNKKSNATVTSMSTDELKISLDGTEYDMSKMFKDYMDANSGVVAVGVKGNFSLDAFGKVAAIDVAASTYTYGYLTAYQKKSVTDDNPIVLSIMAAGASELQTYALKDSFYVNGTRYKTDDSGDIDEVTAMLDNAANAYIEDGAYIKGTEQNVSTTPNGQTSGNTYYVPQAVEFSVSGTKDGYKLIDKIFIQDAGNEGKTDLINTALVPAKYGEAEKATAANSGSGRKLGNYYIDSTTKVIIVPQDKEGKFYSRSYSSINSGTSYYFNAYDATATKVGLLVIYESNASESSAVSLFASDIPYLVSNVNISEFVDGEELQGIEILNATSDTKETLYKDDETEVYTVKLDGENYVKDETISFEALKVGDIVRFVKDGNRFLNIEVVVQAEALEPFTRGIAEESATKNSDFRNTKYGTLLGTASEWDDDNLVVTKAFVGGDTLNTEITDMWPVSESVPVYVVDTSKTKNTERLAKQAKGNIYDFAVYGEEASKIFGFKQWTTVKFIVVFK